MGAVLSGIILSGSATPALANDATTTAGGASAPGRPAVTSLECPSAPSGTCRRGDELIVRGQDLGGVRTVVFLGRKGRADDRRVSAGSTDGHEIALTVPAKAKTGPLQLLGRRTERSKPTFRLLVRGAAPAPSLPSAAPSLPAGKVFLDGPPATYRYSAPAGARIELVRAADAATVASWTAQPDADGNGTVQWDGKVDGQPAPVGRYSFRVVGATQARAAQSGSGGASDFELLDHLFPIRGKHDLGQTATNDFGGPRNHKGQDMFAKCGTPLAAARGGVVTKAAYESAAGNYAVITGDDGRSYVYMHMLRPAKVTEGQRVLTGTPVGLVGETGRASGCHLHFEMWTAPGWYQGGRPVDPLPELRRWDAASSAASDR